MSMTPDDPRYNQNAKRYGTLAKNLVGKARGMAVSQMAKAANATTPKPVPPVKATPPASTPPTPNPTTGRR